MTALPGRLVLLSGLPGSGKSTLSRRVEAERLAVRLNPDEWMTDLQVDLFDDDLRERLERRFWLLAQQLTLAGATVVLDYGFWLRSERDAKRAWCREHGVAVELHVLDVPIEELVRRVEARDGVAEPYAVPLTRATLESYLPAFDLPGPPEQALFDPPLST
ncbi:MAG: AAA family ATPase [Lapillicoccus sp.]